MMTDLDEFVIYCEWFNRLEAMESVKEFRKLSEGERDNLRRMWVAEGLIRPVFEKPGEG